MPSLPTYNTHVKPRLQEIKEWLEQDICTTNEEIWTKLGISRTSFYVWKKEHEEFARVIDTQKPRQNAQLVNSFFRLTQGYMVEEKETITDPDGNVTTKTKTKYIPPSPNLVKWGMINRMPDEWKQIVQPPPNADVEDDGFLEALEEKTEKVWDDENEKN